MNFQIKPLSSLILNHHLNKSQKQLRIKNFGVQKIDLQGPRKLLTNRTLKLLSQKHIKHISLQINRGCTDKSQLTDLLKKVLHARLKTFDLLVSTSEYPYIFTVLKHYRGLRSLENLHVTLRFINNMKQIEKDVGRILHKNCRNLKSVSLALEASSELHKNFQTILNGVKKNNKLRNFKFSASFSNLNSEELLYLQEALIPSKNSLRALNLDLNTNGDIRDQGLKHIQQLVNNLKFLEVWSLNLLGTYVSDEGVTSLLQSLAKNTRLTHFKLHLKNVQTIDSILCSFFKNQPQLSTVSLHFINCRAIDSAKFKALTNELVRLPHLQNYTLVTRGCSKLKDDCMSYVARSLRQFSRLKELKVFFDDVLDSKIGTVIATELHESFKSFSYMESLLLSFSSSFSGLMNDKQALFLEPLKDLKKLQKLSISIKYNQFTPDMFRNFCRFVQALQCLKSLEIDLGSSPELKQDQVSMLLFSVTLLPHLESLAIFADGASYSRLDLILDLQEALIEAKKLKEFYLSLMSALSNEETLEVVEKTHKAFPRCLITLRNKSGLFSH